MSFVFAVPEIMASAAADLTGIGSTVSAANAAAAGSTTSVLAAGADDVSAAIAAMFGAHGQAYQALSAQAEQFHAEFVRAMNSATSAYAGAEAANLQAVLGGSLATSLVNAELAFNGSLVAGESALGQAVGAVSGGVNSGVAGLLNSGFNSFNLAVGTGEQFVNTLVGAPVPANFNGSLALGGSFQTGQTLVGGFNGALNGALNGFGTQLSGALSGNLGGGNLGGGVAALSALIPSGGSLMGNINAGLSGLSGSLGATIPAWAGSFNADLMSLGAQVNAAVSGAANGNFSGLRALVDTAAALPNVSVAQLGQIQSGMLTGLVNAELGFNQSLVANELALETALFGSGTALNGAVNYGFNAANLLFGTGEQLVNAVVGAPAPASFAGSLIVGGSLEGGVPTGGLVGVAQQLLSLNAALGGPAIGGSLLQQLGLTPAGLAGMLNSQLAFNANLVATEMALQQGTFGTNSALNGAANHAFNMVNFVVGAGEQTVDALLGVPTPATFTDSLLVTGGGDVFGGVTTGGLLGALEQKFLMDGAFLSMFGVPVQWTLDGNLVGMLTGTATGGGTVGGETGGGGTVGGETGGEVGGGTGGEVGGGTL
ncbi:PE family protein [Mycobacterium angelicum]|uniref:PE domain-containing protein n=1 Tax=Mycobacterium angelicum TaxID=470074 RepID=A0A1W9ZBG1_MYCAN|nr:PE family protein [Mycobacterium angelicum]MCV7196107.1 PE family protein [Mycobacterium angelicum]ORA11314.1 hypothetical protein BST12_25920 [Mycobacterium angelicum]